MGGEEGMCPMSHWQLTEKWEGQEEVGQAAGEHYRPGPLASILGPLYHMGTWHWPPCTHSL